MDRPPRRDGCHRAQIAAMKVDAARMAAAMKTEYAQNAAPAIAKVQAQLAQELAEQDAIAPRQRVMIDGQGFSLRGDSGWLGVSPEDVTTQCRAKDLKLSAPRGVYISEVEKESPAEKAGLK